MEEKSANKEQSEQIQPWGTRCGWVKYENNPVIGGSLGSCFDICVLKEGELYRMYFSWRPQKSIAYIESKDGVNWTEPRIVLSPRVESGWENDINRPSVVKREDGYHMWYTGQMKEGEWSDFTPSGVRVGNSWIGYAKSSDGLNWVRASEKPVLSFELPWEKGSVMCPSVVWDEEALLYKMWYSGGELYEPDAIGYATSKDGVNWNKHPDNPIFFADPSNDWEKTKVTACQVFKHGGWYYNFYIGFQDVHTARIGIARSKDGVSGWQRHPLNPLISPDPGAWDQDSCYKPYTIFDGEKWLLWYNGRNNTLEQIGAASHDGEDFGFDK